MKIKSLYILCLLLAANLFASAQTFRLKKEFRSACDGTGKMLVTTEEYNTAGNIIRSSKSNKKTTNFTYDSKNRLVSKVHTDSTGRITRFNKITYNEIDGSNIDTLFNADSSFHTIFRRRHSKVKNQDIVTWDLAKYKGSTLIQTIKLDDNNNEIENNLCSSSSECTTTITTYNGNKKLKVESYRKEEMYRKAILYETQTYEYDTEGRVSKITVQNNMSNTCDYILTYSYE